MKYLYFTVCGENFLLMDMSEVILNSVARKKRSNQSPVQYKRLGLQKLFTAIIETTGWVGGQNE
jgi:hypothetical protein